MKRSERAAIMRRRAMFLSSTLATLSCSSSGPGADVPEPVVQIPQPSATVQASTTTEPSVPTTPPKVKGLESWQQVEAKAPPLSVPAGAPPGDKSELESMSKVLAPSYAILESVWSSAPLDCDYGQPKCDQRWSAFEKAMEKLEQRIDGMEPLCGPAYDRTVATVRYRTHMSYLRNRHRQLREAADRTIKTWGEKQHAAYVAANPLKVMMRPCLSCAAPMGLSLTGSMVKFEPGSAALDDDDRRSLDYVVSNMQRHKATRVRVQGHADSAESQPKRVAAARAKAVVSYLVSKGVAKSQLDAVNLATTLPISNAHGDITLNRRVDFQPIP